MAYTITYAGTDLCAAFGMILTSVDSVPPEPKVKKVDVPFGNDIDLSESIAPIAYGNGKHKLVMHVIGSDAGDTDSRIDNFCSMVHGKKSDYAMSWDAGKTYNGRWQVTDIERIAPTCAKLEITIDRQPYARRGTQVHTFNAAPTVTKTFKSGARRQRVYVTASNPVSVVFNGKTINFPAGTNMTNADLVFTAGDNVVKFTPSAWDFYVSGKTLVVKDEYLAIAGSTATFSGGLDSVSGETLVLDDSKSSVTVRYAWEDL